MKLKLLPSEGSLPWNFLTRKTILLITRVSFLHTFDTLKSWNKHISLWLIDNNVNSKIGKRELEDFIKFVEAGGKEEEEKEDEEEEVKAEEDEEKKKKDEL